ncbi:MAG: tRNA dihydrouridine synthase DusB [Abditibacteriota bacterium]|nr:tRNA dihydrouridine synthase DusB [Abditibacteriota bacterium]
MKLPSLSIGGLDIATPLVLAPMAGVSNHALRVLCKRLGGVGLVSSEMFSAYAIRYRDPKTPGMVDWTCEERPVSCQLFGGDPETCAIAAVYLQEQGADIIDINFGCPVPKVAKSGSGASILKDLTKARAIIRHVRSVCRVPLTVKTRLGWYEGEPTVFEFARIAADCGVDALTVHGRYARQNYSGRADWDMIARVRDMLPARVPLIANGDVSDGPGLERILSVTGCQGVMIGRAAMGSPWIFRDLMQYAGTGVMPPPLSAGEILQIARIHNRILRDIHGDRRAAKEMRGNIVHYIKGFDNSAKLRNAIMQTKSTEEIEDILNEAGGVGQSGVFHEKQDLQG